MAEDNIEALNASFPSLSLAQSTQETRFEDKSSNEPSSSNLAEAPRGLATRRFRHHIKWTQSSNADNEDAVTKNSIHARKDSHSGNDNDKPTNELPRVDTSNSELEKMKQQYGGLNKRYGGLKKQAKRYKIELEEALSERRSISRELENKKAELKVCQGDLESAKVKNQQLQCLIGTGNITFDDIRFEKICNADDSTKVILEAEFKVVFSKDLTFPYKEWRDQETGRLRKARDEGAIAVVEIFREFYAAKCGKEQEDPHSFIDKKLWTKQVISLSKVIGSELEWTWAQHAELQLIAFCITQLLKKRGLRMVDLKNLEVYEADPKQIFLVTIYVSQPPCKKCQHFIDKIHKVVGKYGWWFNPVNRRYRRVPTDLQIGQEIEISSEYLV